MGPAVDLNRDADRRQYRRVQAPVYCRPMGKPLFGREKTKAIDISAGGLRIYTDDEMKRGDRLELELFLPDGSSIVTAVEIVWVDHLDSNAPARYDMGLKFIDPESGALEKLAGVLESAFKTTA